MYFCGAAAAEIVGIIRNLYTLYVRQKKWQNALVYTDSEIVLQYVSRVVEPSGIYTRLYPLVRLARYLEGRLKDAGKGLYMLVYSIYIKRIS